MMKRISLLVVAAVLTVHAPSIAGAAELVYFYSETCPTCEQWDEEVGSLYDKTIEAKRLDLRRLSIHDDPPADLSFIKGVIYTPTFVVVKDGQEVGRMVGYIADYFFWERMGKLIKRLDVIKASACQETADAPNRVAC